MTRRERFPVPAASVLSARSADPAQTAAELAETLVARCADHAAVHLLDEPPGETSPTGRPIPAEFAAAARHAGMVLRRVAVAHGPRAVRPDALAPAGGRLRPPALGPLLRSLSDGETVHVRYADSLTAEHLATELGDHELAASLRNCSILLVPLKADAKVLGHALLTREPGHPPFADDTVATCEIVARWAALSIASGGAHERAARLADELRQGLSPDPPPPLTDIELCYRYLPASRAARIGGDWFDVIPLAGGRVALVMGDVMGHGVRAAIVMSRCKTIMRTLVLLGMPPDEALQRFDELASRHDDDHVATCLMVVYDPATGHCHAANAGQIPPVLVHPDGHGEVLDLPTGTPVGVGGCRFEATGFDTAPGSILALCTDGLTGLHDADVDRALARMCAALSAPARSLDEICDAVFAGLDPAAGRDDVTLLLSRFLDERSAG
ncbi:MAG TPA: PP2C family protein-serine/threonine phosphatase [Streptosporangiaceae bacterium]|nr:PP2C family protein-serine/threonine phosphatase [Streptosporangiaceae bacterium]